MAPATSPRGWCGGTSLVFLPAVLIPTACCLYALRTWPALGPQRLRSAAIMAVAVGMPLAPLVILELYGGPMRCLMTHFTFAFFGVLTFFRTLELFCGTGPKGFDASLLNFVVYFTSPAEVLFDKDGRFKAAPVGDLAGLLFRIFGHMLAGTLVLSVGRETSFTPFLPECDDIAELPWFGLPRSLAAIWLQAAYVYCLLCSAMLMHRLPLSLVGIATLDPFDMPLLRSSSVRDFWGRRWNLVIHRLMKRTFFAPFARNAKHVGGLLAFVMSGLFHEYMWMVLNWHEERRIIPGICTLFFIAQFALAGMEAALARTSWGKRAAALPRPVQTALVTLVILPFGPLFLSGIRFMAVQCTQQQMTVAAVPSGGAPEGAGSSPPLDWVLTGGAALVAAMLHMRQRLRQRRAAIAGEGKGGAIIVPLEPTSPSLGA